MLIEVTKGDSSKRKNMETEKIKIGIVGGDARQSYLADSLTRKGAECAVWGFPYRCTDLSDEDAPVRCASWECAVKGADAVILPLPATADGVRVNCRALYEQDKNGEYDVRLTEIVGNASKDTVLLGGKIPASLYRFARENGKKLRDYYESEEFQIKNALPTAEGAIFRAMESLPTVISHSDAAVVGYGRIGRTLAQRLLFMGANVDCIARSIRDLSWAWVDGCRPVLLSEYLETPRGYDVIFNTVPHVLFDGPVLRAIDKKTLFVELASQSGGIDADAAAEYGIRVVKAASLPGKCSPETAGAIMSDSVVSILHEEGVL